MKSKGVFIIAYIAVSKVTRTVCFDNTVNRIHTLVDGTITTQPEFSFWFSDVGWKVENYGTDPDYEVDFAPQDYRNQTDPQIDKAIELINDELNKAPFKLPNFGERPNLALPILQRGKRNIEKMP